MDNFELRVDNNLDFKLYLKLNAYKICPTILYTETKKLGISFRLQAILPFVKRQQKCRV